jgi:hypothetical protein
MHFPTQTTNNLMGTVVQIAAGSDHTVAVNTAGDVYAWGGGQYGEMGYGTINFVNPLPKRTSNVSNVVRIYSNASNENMVRTRDGTIFIWGYNFDGAIGNGSSQNASTPWNISGPAGSGGNPGRNITVIGMRSAFASTVPEAVTPAGESFIPGDGYTVSFPASTLAGTTQIRAFDPTATGLNVPVGYTIEANSTGYDFTTTAQFTGNVQVCLKTPNVISQTIFNRLVILHDDNFDGTFDAPQVTTKDYQRREICRVAQSFSPFVLAQGLAVPTAARVLVGGRVLTAKGLGIRNVQVSITDSQGNTRTVVSSSFGYYQFAEVPVGETYVISVTAKKYIFSQPVQITSILEDTSDIDFIAEN